MGKLSWLLRRGLERGRLARRRLEDAGVERDDHLQGAVGHVLAGERARIPEKLKTKETASRMRWFSGSVWARLRSKGSESPRRSENRAMAELRGPGTRPP
eukprot:14748526-Alexandrium_andersonii.AAC.1